MSTRSRTALHTPYAIHVCVYVEVLNPQTSLGEYSVFSLGSIPKACQPNNLSVQNLLWCGNRDNPYALLWSQVPPKLYMPVCHALNLTWGEHWVMLKLSMFRKGGILYSPPLVSLPLFPPKKYKVLNTVCHIIVTINFGQQIILKTGSAYPYWSQMECHPYLVQCFLLNSNQQVIAPLTRVDHHTRGKTQTGNLNLYQSSLILL